MPSEHVIAIDPSKPLAEQPETGHNRWHEAIEPVWRSSSGTRSSTRPVTPSTGSSDPGSTAQDVARPGARAGPSADRSRLRQGRRAGRSAGGRAPRHRGRSLGPVGVHRPGAGLRLPARRFPGAAHRPLAAGRERRRTVRAAAGRANPLQPVPRHVRAGAERRAARARDAAGGRARGPRGHGPAPGRRRRHPGRRTGGERGPAHHPAARDRRQHGHQADHSGRDDAAAGVRRGRARLDRGRALRAGRLRGLRHRDRDPLARPHPLRRAQGRGRGPGHPRPPLLPRRLVRAGRARGASALLRHDGHLREQGRRERERGRHPRGQKRPAQHDRLPRNPWIRPPAGVLRCAAARWICGSARPSTCRTSWSRRCCRWTSSTRRETAPRTRSAPAGRPGARRGRSSLGRSRRAPPGRSFRPSTSPRRPGR